MGAIHDLIKVGDQRLSGTVGGDEMKVTRLSGWWGRPPAKRQAVSRELADGDFPVPWHMDSRYIGIDGIATACSHESAHALMNRMSGLCAARRETLVVGGHGTQMSAEVEADEQAYFHMVTDKTFQFELRFKANDPRKLGFEHSEDIGASPLSISHRGNYFSWPVMEVDPSGGELPEAGFTVDFQYEDGSLRRWWYEFPVTTTHRIDFYTGIQRVGTTNQNSIRRADDCVIRPGESVDVSVYPTGQPSSDTVQGRMWWRDTWI